jgi:hypothetical protein
MKTPLHHFAQIMGMTLLLFTTACGPSAEQLAATYVAETSAAASPTPLPTDTPLPTSTHTPTLTSTPTSTPTNTPTNTATALPTNTPTITPTPGPLFITDDFSEQSDIWGECPGCVWSSGKLHVGPYDPGDTENDTHPVICEACGEKEYYRIAVDVAFEQGYSDRGFGLLIGDNDYYFTDLEISTLFQTCIVWRYDYKLFGWKLLNRDINNVLTGLVAPSYSNNHLEVTVRPSGQEGRADYYIKINGTTLFVLYTQIQDPSRVGLVVGYHSIGVAFDNFEFEEIVP